MEKLFLKAGHRKRLVFARFGRQLNFSTTCGSGCYTLMTDPRIEIGKHDEHCCRIRMLRLIVTYNQQKALVDDVCRFKFSGMERDLSTGFYYYGYRFYAPQWQRWISRDLIGEEGGLNLYLFCLGNSINVGDPNGLSSPGPGMGDFPLVCVMPDGRIVFYQRPGSSGGSMAPGNMPPVYPRLPPGYKCKPDMGTGPVICGPATPTPPTTNTPTPPKPPQQIPTNPPPTKPTNPPSR